MKRLAATASTIGLVLLVGGCPGLVPVNPPQSSQTTQPSTAQSTQPTTTQTTQPSQAPQTVVDHTASCMTITSEVAPPPEAAPA
ncbi:MAG: hypothetical protein FJ246_11325 [Nitrospira sp.]|nr:hypothetical protein [Nitrospira sp.]